MAEFFKSLVDFSSTTNVVRFVCIILILAIIVYEIVRLVLNYKKKKKNAPETAAEAEITEQSTEDAAEKVEDKASNTDEVISVDEKVDETKS